MLLTAAGVLVVVAIHTAIATVLLRYFRVQLDTRWGTVAFALFFIPVALTASLLIVGQLPIFHGMDRNTVMLVAILFPIMLGAAVDLFWLPSPAEVATELRTQERS